jgi:hypothetical protein
LVGGPRGPRVAIGGRRATPRKRKKMAEKSSARAEKDGASAGPKKIAIPSRWRQKTVFRRKGENSFEKRHTSEIPPLVGCTLGRNAFADKQWHNLSENSCVTKIDSRKI